jgi:hypothetical protein
VQHDDLAVGRAVDVELEDVGAVGAAAPERHDRVLRRDARGAAMTEGTGQRTRKGRHHDRPPPPTA